MNQRPTLRLAGAWTSQRGSKAKPVNTVNQQSPAATVTPPSSLGAFSASGDARFTDIYLFS